jgi:hypothetical protein
MAFTRSTYFLVATVYNKQNRTGVQLKQQVRAPGPGCVLIIPVQIKLLKLRYIVLFVQTYNTQRHSFTTGSTIVQYLVQM